MDCQPGSPRMQQIDDTKRLMWRALAGESLSIDSMCYSLHDMTQLAVALQPGADIAIRHASTMTPIERASISTVGKGRVLFF